MPPSYVTAVWHFTREKKSSEPERPFFSPSPPTGEGEGGGSTERNDGVARGRFFGYTVT